MIRLTSIKSRLRRRLDNYTYTVRRGVAKGLKRRGGFAFIGVGAAVSPEEKLLTGIDLRGKTVYDIGAWEGIFTIFFARAVGPSGMVVVFEPNPANSRRITENVDLNGFANVQIRQIALGRSAGRATLVVPHESAGAGSVDARIQEKLLERGPCGRLEVDIDSLDHQVELDGLAAPDFVKIDVEGLELAVLEGGRGIIRRCKPDLFIEMHGADLAAKTMNVRSTVELVEELGYAIHHVETQQRITRLNAGLGREGHLYCQWMGR